MSDQRSMNSLVSSISRREWLKASGCGFGYLALAGLCAEQAAADSGAAEPDTKPAYLNPLAPKPTHFKAKAKRVIMLFMQGGPSHVDTFDYKPKLQRDSGKPGERGMLLGSPFKFEQHGSGGLWISELFPNIAKHADELCVINGMHTDNPAHPQATIQLHTGTATFVRPSMGAWVLYGLGTTNQNLPGFITINPPSGLGGAQNYGSSFLPAAYQGTRLGARGEMADVVSPEPLGEQRRQLDLLQSMNRDFAPRSGAPDQIDGVIQSFELGFRMQSQLPELLNISKESPATLQMYGIEGGVGAPITERQRRAGPNSDNFARQCLMARRLAQAGVRFIEVCLPGWDQHNNLHQAMTRNALSTDRAIGALLTDLKSHGMLEDTLVVWGGEFGRTPTGQGGDGRNHNNRGYSMWLAGGGTKGGTTWGKTDDYGAAAVENPVHTHDLHATILALLGLDHERLTYRYAGRDFRLTDVSGTVVKSIIA